jgi:AAA domain
MPRTRPRIAPPEEITRFRGLIFGTHGAGKTRMLGTANLDERTYPMLFLASEAGTQTLVGLDPPMDVMPATTWADFNDAMDILDAPDHGGYRSVGLDSISEVQIEGLLRILDDDSNRPDPNILGKPDWGKILVQMRRFTRMFKNLDMHVFMTALAKDEERPRLGTVKVPLLQGAFADELPGLVDTVAYLAQEDLPGGNVQRTLFLHSFPKFSVKARTPWDAKIPAEIVAPTVTSLLDTLGFNS